MTEMEKMMAFHAMQTIKEAPEWSQDMNLVLLCKMDSSGKMENLARILADHNMPTKEIVPCVMDILQSMLIGMNENEKGALNNGTEANG